MQAGESNQVIVHTITQLCSDNGSPVVPPHYSQESAEQRSGEERVLSRLIRRYERDFPKRTLRLDWVSPHGFMGEVRLAKGSVLRFSVLITPVEPNEVSELSEPARPR